ncbi:hypothetical protein IG631_11225 [Alternaria alternata]|nr:hypothetical protein IG631_11225 [Alternaria alternata]
MGTVETSERSFRHGAAAILATWPGEGYARVLILVQDLASTTTNLFFIPKRTDTMHMPSLIIGALMSVGFVSAQGSLESWHPARPGECTFQSNRLCSSHHDQC